MMTTVITRLLMVYFGNGNMLDLTHFLFSLIV